MLNLQNYQNYLSFIDKTLSKFFVSQHEYIKCKKGCALCCKNAQFPFSFIEFSFLLSGFYNLDKSTKNIIESNITNIIHLKKFSNSEKFLYDCPLLIDNACSLYNYRGIVCRTFGLPCNDKSNIHNTKVPFCYKFGLNYAQVIDNETISLEKFQNSGLKSQPLGFNLQYDFLTGPAFEKQFNFKFGNKLPLIDWFILNIK